VLQLLLLFLIQILLLVLLIRLLLKEGRVVDWLQLLTLVQVLMRFLLRAGTTRFGLRRTGGTGEGRGREFRFGFRWKFIADRCDQTVIESMELVEILRVRDRVTA